MPDPKRGLAAGVMSNGVRRNGSENIAWALGNGHGATTLGLITLGKDEPAMHLHAHDVVIHALEVPSFGPAFDPASLQEADALEE